MNDARSYFDWEFGVLAKPPSFFAAIGPLGSSFSKFENNFIAADVRDNCLSASLMEISFRWSISSSDI